MSWYGMLGNALTVLVIVAAGYFLLKHGTRQTNLAASAAGIITLAVGAAIVIMFAGPAMRSGAQEAWEWVSKNTTTIPAKTPRR